eukprot:6830265-Prymnesium_polylepis.1
MRIRRRQSTIHHAGLPQCSAGVRPAPSCCPPIARPRTPFAAHVHRTQSPPQAAVTVRARRAARRSRGSSRTYGTPWPQAAAGWRPEARSSEARTCHHRACIARHVGCSPCRHAHGFWHRVKWTVYVASRGTEEQLYAAACIRL